jgi:tryptophanase
LQFIFDAAIKFLLDVATHQHGCYVLQRCIDFSKGKSLEKLVKEICKYGFSLAQDPYG